MSRRAPERTQIASKPGELLEVPALDGLKDMSVGLRSPGSVGPAAAFDAYRQIMP